MKKVNKRLFLISLFLLKIGSAFGQLSYTFSAFTIPSYSYNPAPTIIMGPLTDDAISALTPIGFNFVYQGTSYSNVKISSNGWLTFDGFANQSLPTNNLSNAVFPTILAPLWDNLRCTSIGNVNYQLLPDIAFPGKSIFSVEWKLMAWNGINNQEVLSIQLRLFEVNNSIEFHYRSENFNPTNATASVGITGSCKGDFYSLDDLSNLPTCLKSNENSILVMKPQSGQIYRFAPDAALTPTNDLCANAIALPYNAGNCISKSGTVVGATATGSPAAPACWSPVQTDNDVWYVVTKPAGETTMLISTDNSILSCFPFSTELAVYSGTCGSLTLLGCASSGGILNPQNASLALSGLPAAATNYFIRVEGDAATVGVFQICVKATNDECSGATLLNTNVTCNYFYTTSVGATSSTTTPLPNVSSGYTPSAIDVWFKFVATTNFLIIDTKDLSMIDGAMAIYKGVNCLSFATMPSAFPDPNPFDDNLSNNGKMPRIARNDFSIGVVYYLRVWANSAPLSGSFGICISERKGCLANAADTCAFAPTIGLGTWCGDNTQSRVTRIGLPAFPLDPNDPLPAMYCTSPAPFTGASPSNPTIDNVVYYKFLTDNLGGNVVLNVFSQMCSKAFGLQVGLFKPTVACAGGANWAKAKQPCYDGLRDPLNDRESDPKDFTMNFTGLLPNTFYYLLFDGASVDKCTWNMTLTGPVTLPIELLNFNGKQKNNYNLLEWTTKTETNNDYFILERSADAQNFEPIERVQGSGNTSFSVTYSAKDFNPIDGINYYRLKQVDFNGEYHLSDVIAINSESDNVLQITTIYPNPAENQVTISIFSQTDISVNFSVFDLYGKLIQEKKIVLIEGVNSIQQALEGFAPGLYFFSLQVPQKKKQYNSKFLKMN